MKTFPPNIPWINPSNLTPEQVGVQDGWRLCIANEPCDQPNEFYLDGDWHTGVTTSKNVYSSDFLCTYRTRAPLPPQYQQEESEPDYTSREYQKKVLDAAWDGKVTQYLGGSSSGVEVWFDHAGLVDVVDTIKRGWPIRINPEPKTVPLDDYRVGEAIRLDDVPYGIMVITSVSESLVTFEFGNMRQQEHTHKYLMEHGMIYRNGEWIPCSKIVEQ